MTKSAVIPFIAPRHAAANLYWQGWKLSQIAEKTGVKYQTLDSWKRRDGWDKASIAKQVNASTHARLCQLVAKSEKTERDLQEIDSLGKLLERTARIQRFEQGGAPSDLNPSLRNKSKGKAAAGKNVLTNEHIEQLQKSFDECLFEYQRVWFKAKKHRTRNILKSRQIGATWYFAREALLDAAKTGDNQIFLSASKAQAHVFKGYIIDWVKEVTGVELKGDPIKLGHNDAMLYFLGTNSRTAQSYHGHLYFDEYHWVYKFHELRKVSSGMAAHKKWRKTYFSVPSTLSSEAYEFWAGKLYNKGRSKAERKEFKLTHAALKNGLVCPDGQWRQIVTVEDAEAGGCTLFDIGELRLEYAKQEFRNLFMCEFVDAAASIFSLTELQRCMVDSWTAWQDLKPLAERPLGNLPVWIGYDPSRSRDNASVVVVAPPQAAGGLFRVVQKESWNNISFDEQAKRLKKLTEKYNVQAINIDASGMGLAVYELVKQFFPRTHKIIYSVESKTRLVIKAQHLIQNRRIKFDAGWTDMLASLLAIHRSVTDNSKHITYKAGRSGDTGHADIAWALFNALDEMALESVDRLSGKKKGSITWSE